MNEKIFNRRWTRGIRPLLWWLLLVAVLFGLRTHQRLSEQTQLVFSLSLQGQPLYGATVKLDEQTFESGWRIPVGWHRLDILHPKADSFSTNFFIWYGNHDFGDIALNRAYGNLTVSVSPPARWLVIQGPEWSATLKDSSGTNATVPTDAYSVEADFPHSKEQQQLVVGSFSSPRHIAPSFGTVQLDCNQTDAIYQLQDENGQDISAGALPATITELPVGDYSIFASHHGNQRKSSVFVKVDETNEVPVDFDYGMAVFETTPPGVAVSADNGRQYGETPLALNELLAGTWNFTLQHDGYASVQVAVAVTADQTNFISTNLVSFNYINAMNAAQQYLAESNYNQAGVAVDQAIQAAPSDVAAIALQQKITMLSNIQIAESEGRQGNFTAGIKSLQSALSLEPDNKQAKQLLADYQKREPEQLERERQLARLNAPKQAFDAALGQNQYAGASFYRPLYFTTGKNVHDVGPALYTALTNEPSPWVVTRFEFPVPDIFVVEAKQSFFGGMRKCVIIGGQAKDDETQIWGKVLEYDANHTLVVQSLLNIKDNVQYNIINPTAYGPSDYHQQWVRDGVQRISERIQRAIEQ